MTAPESRSFRVATYNVLDPGFGTLAPWDERRENVAATIIASGASIVALQEAGWTSVREGITLARDVAALTGFELSTASHSGDAIVFDPQVWSAGDGGHFALPHGRGDRRRSAIWQHLRDHHSGEHLLIVATHLSHGPERAWARIRQARRIARQARSINQGNDPVVVLGDFNSWAGRDKRTPLDTFSTAGFTEAIPPAGPDGTPGIGSIVGSHPGQRLDHILVSPNLLVVDASVADPKLSGPASDHRLVWADLGTHR